MKLVVKNNFGETVTLQIQPEETFIDLKKRVECEAGISLDLTDITSNGKNMLDTQKVMEYFMSGVTLSEGEKEEEVNNVACSVPGCGNTKASNDDKVFFDFPQEEIRCHQWVLYCQRLSMISGKHRLSLSNDSAICSDHFRTDQFVKNTTTLLKRTAVPCINPELPAVDSLKYGNIQKIRPTKSDDTTADELICRLCAKGCRDCIFIYSKEGRRLELAEKINSILPVNVKMMDNLPKQVCGPCIEQLNSLSYLAKLSTTSESRLNEVMSENTPKNIVLTDGRDVTLQPTEQSCPLCYEGWIGKLEEENKEKEEKEPEPEQAPLPEEAPFPASQIKSEINQISTDESTQETTLSSTEEKTYKCRVCREEFEEFPSVVQHSFSHFEDGFYQCVLCEVCYPSPTAMVDHLFSHKPQNNACQECEMSFKTEAELTNHICDTNKPLIKCKMCSKSFRSQSRLEFHMHFHNNINQVYCETCGKGFPDEIKLYKHTVQLHGNEKNKCDDCGKIFSTVNSLKYHEKSHQGTNCKPYVCEWCGKGFIRKSMLRNHVTSTHRLIQEVTCFTCKNCKEAFATTTLAVAHMESKHGETEGKGDEQSYSFEMHTVSRLFICEYCEKHFAQGKILNKHREDHVTDNPYSCKYCSQTFPSFAEQSKHKSTHKDTDIPLEYHSEINIPVNYLCEFCNRCFLNHLKFTEHLTIHYGPEPYVCRLCNLKFATLQEVSQHRLTHGSNEPFEEFDFNRPYECHYCNKCFAIEDALVKHIRMHTGEKPFICDQCGKGFSQSSGLNTHKKVHSDLRPYSCPLCPRTFKIKGDRDVHIRKHSGDRPYKCEFCGKAFMTQHVYSQHRKIHTGERPYKCDVCGIAFRRSHVLTVHKRIHTGEKPNICDICGKRYRQKGDMLKHRRAQHGNIKIQGAHFLNLPIVEVLNKIV
ncbi:zinc finger protein 93-like [Cimex lectularius]|uniref:Zinc finger protein n=1 Tax=Cimex lectularius TaxID=79782 RepID=A0A8I6S0T9_CIMLE|nr:zinc finger protein 93-like [Cimex lectularius]XP_014256092.1 zinc finger protein 93-like [Cimex lectularius]